MKSVEWLPVLHFAGCYRMPRASRLKMTLRVKRVSSPDELAKAFAIRVRVFVKEQRVPQEIELDRDDRLAVHFLALLDGRAVGTARLVMRRGAGKIGRMAVLKNYRRKGVGTKLLKRCIGAAKRRGAQKIYLHAQVSVVGFYERMGFRCAGSVFKEAGIPHRKMIWRKHEAAGKKSHGSMALAPHNW